MARTFYKEHDGNSVDVSLQYSISGEQPILVEGIAGFPFESGDSGDTRAIRSDGGVYSVQLPAGLAVSFGDVVYVTVASVTAHEIPDGAYSISLGTGKIPFLMVLSEKNANNWADCKLLPYVGSGSSVHGMPIGQLYVNDLVDVTAISDTVSYFVANLTGAIQDYTTQVVAGVDDFDMPVDGRLRYIGSAPISAHIACTVSFTVAGVNQLVHMRLGKNGSPSEAAEFERLVGTGVDSGSSALHLVVGMVENDYIELFIQNETAANDVTIRHANLQMVGGFAI